MPTTTDLAQWLELLRGYGLDVTAGPHGVLWFSEEGQRSSAEGRFLDRLFSGLRAQFLWDSAPGRLRPTGPPPPDAELVRAYRRARSGFGHRHVLEPHVAALVRELNALGLYPEFCCEGHLRKPAPENAEAGETSAACPVLGGPMLQFGSDRRGAAGAWLTAVILRELAEELQYAVCVTVRDTTLFLSSAEVLPERGLQREWSFLKLAARKLTERRGAYREKVRLNRREAPIPQPR